MNGFDNMWDFEVKEGVTFKHANRVYSIMQKRIQKILEELSGESNIKKIVLYGNLDYKSRLYEEISKTGLLLYEKEK
ncbi:hypothetical protein [Parablautia intestinalis]|uniref:hypothetical protein n=1 Tax=Parablautia intestinalis TaxID=2320100 RepID=UPI00259D1B61|nr:hypothetical protein [Parablautia intestinalis]